MTPITQKRPPIIAIMGHVDHGKTTLLDYIRKTRVADREAGGITQSIGAYEIEHQGRKITFIDTPGHEAFANMRAHSAKVADVAILVVAADDGVKPQTLNALHFIQEEKIPYVIALNKIDKPNADVERAKQTLLTAGVYLEGMGGDISFHAISAKTGEGINELLDLTLLTADLEDLSVDVKALSTGIVLTSRLDPRKGIVVGVIIKNGILRRGELIATPTAKGKVKMLSNFLGENVSELLPSAPALIIGFETLPHVGEEFFGGETALGFCKNIKTEVSVREEIPENAIRLVLKAEESSALYALKSMVCSLAEKEKREIVIIAASVGDIYETDIKLTRNTNATLVAFKSKIDRATENIVKNEKISFISSGIIYEIEEILKKKAFGILPERAPAIELLKIFGEAKGKEQVVGGRVIRGTIFNHASFEIWKEEKTIGEGKILNLQSGKQDKKSVEEGMEVGLLIESEIPLLVGMELRFLEN